MEPPWVSPGTSAIRIRHCGICRQHSRVRKEHCPGGQELCPCPGSAPSTSFRPQPTYVSNGDQTRWSLRCCPELIMEFCKDSKEESGHKGFRPTLMGCSLREALLTPPCLSSAFIQTLSPRASAQGKGRRRMDWEVFHSPGHPGSWNRLA